MCSDVTARRWCPVRLCNGALRCAHEHRIYSNTVFLLALLRVFMSRCHASTTTAPLNTFCLVRPFRSRWRMHPLSLTSTSAHVSRCRKFWRNANPFAIANRFDFTPFLRASTLGVPTPWHVYAAHWQQRRATSTFVVIVCLFTGHLWVTMWPRNTLHRRGADTCSTKRSHGNRCWERTSCLVMCHPLL